MYIEALIYLKVLFLCLLILIFLLLWDKLYPFALEASQMLYENAWIFVDWNPRFYFQNLYFCKVNSYFPIFMGGNQSFSGERTHWHTPCAFKACYTSHTCKTYKTLIS